MRALRDRSYNDLLTLNFLNVCETGCIAAEKYQILERTSELNQPIYFKNVLTSEWKSGIVLHWEEAMHLSPQETKSYGWIPSKLIKIRFGHGRPENLGCRHDGRNLEGQQN